MGIVEYINNTYNLNETAESLSTLINFGISWCEDGIDSHDGEKTTYCAECKYYKECSLLHEIFTMREVEVNGT